MAFPRMLITAALTLTFLSSIGCGQAPTPAATMAQAQGASSAVAQADLFYKFPLTAFASVSAHDAQLGRVEAELAMPVLEVKVGVGFRAATTRLALDTGTITVLPGEPHQRQVVVIQAPAKGGDLASYVEALADIASSLTAAGAPQQAVDYVASVTASLR